MKGGTVMKFQKLIVVSVAILATLLGGCSNQGAGKKITVLVRMMPAQERFFRDQLIPAFEKEYKCKVDIATFVSEWDIERMLKLENAKKDGSIALVKTPFEMTRVLVNKGLMNDLYSVMDSNQVQQDLAEYHPLASGLGYIDGKPYYIPRKLETRVFFYLKSKVADAVAKFPKHKDRINSELKAQNGYGLPKDYVLEADPAEWDLYDLLVAGSIWANEEYNGVKMGRIAHRGARYAGTALDLVDRSLQLGASKEDILRLTSDKNVETYLWENVLVRNGVYNAAMWQDQWKGSNIYTGIKDGKVFATFIQQIDAFLIHGWSDDPSMPSYLPDESDMGLCVMPKAVSFELTPEGMPTFEGKRSISTGGWWWGIPKTSPDAKLAYQFARFMTSRENQAKECSRFGMVPVRKDILTNLPEVFDQGWVGDIFKKSVGQIKVNEEVTVPLIKNYAELSQNLIEAWYKLCVEYKEPQNGEKMNFATMKMRLASDYLEKQKQLIGDEYPGE
jgi:ABC-type glycerol-3-phosphate transport system substrate-binding protein